jgi:hypothetical protein
LGEDFEHAGDLIESVWEDLVQHRGEHATLLDWLRRLPSSCVDARQAPHRARLVADLYPSVRSGRERNPET